MPVIKPAHPFAEAIFAWEGPAIATIPNSLPSNSRPHLKTIVGNRTLAALVDSGSDVTAVREDIVRTLTRYLRPASSPAFPVIHDAQKQPMAVMGYYEATFEGPNGLRVNFPFYSVKNLQSECILGWDFQQHTGMVLDAANNTITLGKPKGGPIRLSPPRDLMTVSTVGLTHLRANRSQWVTLSLGLPNCVQLRPGSSVVILSDAGKGYNILDSIVKVENNNKIVVPIANYSCTDTYLPGNTTLSATVIRSDLVETKPLEPHLSEITSRAPGHRPKPQTPPLTEQKRAFLLANLNLDGVPVQLHDFYIRFVLANHDIFSSSKYDLGHSTTLQHHINLRDREPVYVPQFKIPHHFQETILAHVHEWLKCGVIQKCRSPYNSPIFCVAKPSGGLRVVQDLRAVNRHSLDDKYCIMDARECIDTIGRAKSTVFSCLDLSGAFWQLDLHEDSRAATAFTLPFLNTQFCWTRAPMGCKGAPASFSRLMGKVFEGEGNVVTYVDDGLCHSRDHTSHLALLNNSVAPRLRQHGLKLNIKKCFFGRSEVDYLGFHISKHGVSPSKDKIKALRDQTPPTTPEKIDEFLGLANYFRSMIGNPNFARLTYPLRLLCRKSSKWEGGTLPPRAMRSFHEVIRILCSNPVMSYPDPSKPYILSTDAALGDDNEEGGLGAILTQLSDNGMERVVAYWSRQLREHERNYSAYAIELKSICDALDHFHEYVYGSKVTVRCDQRPLEGASRTHTKTINRLTELMNTYDIEIVYRKGALNGGPDFLSRNAISALTANITDAQSNDPFIKAVRTFLTQKILPDDKVLATIVARYAPKCFDLDGQLFFIDSRRGRVPKTRVVAPASLVHDIISCNHGNPMSGHYAVARTVENCLNDYFWPTMAADVASFILRCRICQEKGDPKAKNALTPLRPWPAPSGPNTRVHGDLVGPFKSNTDNKHILVITCAFTKWVELVPIKNKEAGTVARAIFHEWICRWSVMELLVVDGGMEFANKVLKELLTCLGATRHVISPRHPRANAQVEIFNKELRGYLQAFISEHTLDWEEQLPTLRLAHNTAIHKSTRHTPFFLRCLQDPVFPWSSVRPHDGHPVVSRMFDNLVISRDLVAQNNEAARQEYKKHHDRRAKARSFEVGDKVLVYYDNPPLGINAKLYKPWRGLFQVLRINNFDTLTVRRVSDGKTSRVHTDRVKLFHEFDDPHSGNVALDYVPTHSSQSQPTQAQQAAPAHPAHGTTLPQDRETLPLPPAGNAPAPPTTLQHSPEVNAPAHPVASSPSTATAPATPPAHPVASSPPTATAPATPQPTSAPGAIPKSTRTRVIVTPNRYKH